MASLSVIFGGPSLEHDVSILTGLQPAHVLSRSGQEPVALYWSESNGCFVSRPAWRHQHSSRACLREPGASPLELGGREPGFYETRSFGRRERIDISAAVVCCHGGPGEDGRLQGLLDLARIAYTGPGAACAELTMDKLAFGGMAESAGLPVLPRIKWSSSPSRRSPGLTSSSPGSAVRRWGWS